MDFVNDGGGVWRQVERTAMIAQQTLTASTSGTAINFTGIPAGVRRVTMNLTGVSTNGTDPWLVQLGDAGGVESSGYLGAGVGLTDATAIAGANSTAGLYISSASAANVFHGTITITVIDAATFAFAMTAILGKSNAAATIVAGASKTLSAALDRITLTTTGGTNTFDAGSINITYER
jgi:hypothetical protein